MLVIEPETFHRIRYRLFPGLLENRKSLKMLPKIWEKKRKMEEIILADDEYNPIDTTKLLSFFSNAVFGDLTATNSI